MRRKSIGKTIPARSRYTSASFRGTLLRWSPFLAPAAVGRLTEEQPLDLMSTSAVAIGLEPGDEVNWELLDRGELHFVRLKAPSVTAKYKARKL